jgi:macrodomain Ter protein organizer (MatP/YcbG family)
MNINMTPEDLVRRLIKTIKRLKIELKPEDIEFILNDRKCLINYNIPLEENILLYVSRKDISDIEKDEVSMMFSETIFNNDSYTDNFIDEGEYGRVYLTSNNKCLKIFKQSISRKDKMSFDEDKKKKSMQIDKDTWKKLKIISLSEEITINDIVKNLVDMYFVKKKYPQVDESILKK